MIRSILILAVCILSCSLPVRAGTLVEAFILPDELEEEGGPPHFPGNVQEESPGDAALSLSLVGTIFPAGFAFLTFGEGCGRTWTTASLFWGGLIVGPSLGYFRGKLPEKAWLGILSRLSAFALAWMLAPTSDYDDGFLPNPELDSLEVWGFMSLIILGSVIIDICHVRSDVDEAAGIHLKPHAALLPARQEQPAQIRLGLSLEF